MGCSTRTYSVVALLPNEKDEAWVWQSSGRPEKARNRVAHYLDPERADQPITDFVNSVRSNFTGFAGIPGDDDLKKCIFILYFAISRLLALEEFPPLHRNAVGQGRDRQRVSENRVSGGVARAGRRLTVRFNPRASCAAARFAR